MNNEIEYIACWSCDKTVSIQDMSHNDGFCPYCEQEIEFDEN